MRLDAALDFKDARIHKDEVFGPTVNLYPVDDMEGV